MPEGRGFTARFGKAVVHREGLALMMKALKGVEDFEVGLGLSKNELGLKAGVLEMSLTCIAGEYPDYERVIPKPEEWQTNVEVYVPALVEALYEILLIHSPNIPPATSEIGCSSG